MRFFFFFFLAFSATHHDGFSPHSASISRLKLERGNGKVGKLEREKRGAILDNFFV